MQQNAINHRLLQQSKNKLYTIDSPTCGICQAHLGGCSVNVENPHFIKLEKVQRFATRLVSELRGMNYEKRLEELNLAILNSRTRG